MTTPSGAPVVRRAPTWVLVVAIGAVVAYTSVAVAVGSGWSPPALLKGGGSTPAASPAVEHLYLTISYNPASGLDQYYPANFTVPAHVPIVLTITNYDNGTNVVPTMYTHAVGTSGGTMDVLHAAYGAASGVASVPSDQMSHTFTVMPMGAGGSMMASEMMAGPMLNVPVPTAISNADPSVVSATVMFDQTGTYIWLCLAPCDGSAMQTTGFMTGSIHVA